MARGIIFFVLTFSLLTAGAADYQLFEENGKYGVKDEGGKIIITPAFEGLGWSDGSFSVIGQVTGYKSQERWGLINLKAQLITQTDYLTLLPSGGDRVIAKKQVDAISAKVGCIDLKGNVTVPFKYDGIKIQGLQAIAFTKIGNRFNYGVIDLNGNVIIPLIYKNIFTIGSLRYGVQNIENKTALFTESGNQLSAFNIDSISSFIKNKAIVYQGLNQGVVNREGIMEVAPEYREITINENGSIKARMMSKWMLLDAQHNIVKSIACDELTPTASGFIVENGNQYGVWDDNFNAVLPVAYSKIQSFENNRAVVKRGNKFGLVQSDNAVIIPFQYDSIVLQQNFVRVNENLLGKPSWSLYDVFGIRKSERAYESISDFNGQFFQVKNYGLSGIMNRFGKETVHCVYDSILDFNREQLIVKFHGHYGIIDFNENWLVPPQPNQLQLVNENYYLQKEDSTTLFKSIDGELIYFTDNPISATHQLLKEILPDGTEKEINFQGITISRTTPPAVDETEIISSEHEGFRGIRRNGKYGFIDNRGRLRIANRYEGIGHFKNGLAAAKILGKWGFIDTQDKIVINPSYESVSEFIDAIAIVKKVKYGLIDREGNLILETRYDSIQPISTNNFLLHNNHLLGLADESGLVLIEPRFDTLNDFGNGLVIVSRDNKFGLLTETGISAIPMIYDRLYYLIGQDKFLVKMESPWVSLTSK